MCHEQSQNCKYSGHSSTSHSYKYTVNFCGYYLTLFVVCSLQEAKQDVPQEIYKYNMVTKKKSSKLYGDFGPKTDLVGKTATKILFDWYSKVEYINPCWFTWKIATFVMDDYDNYLPIENVWAIRSFHDYCIRIIEYG